MSAPLICTAWQPLKARKSTLIGFADIRLPRSGFTLAGCLVHEKDGQGWVYPPSIEMRKPDGTRAGWRDLVVFESFAAKRAWSAAAVEAVDLYRSEHPETDQGGGWEW